MWCEPHIFRLCARGWPRHHACGGFCCGGLVFFFGGLEALVVLVGGRFLGELQQVAGDLGEGVADFGGGGVEELSAGVDAVDSFVREVMVKAGLDADGVFREEQGVDVEVEWDGGVAEFFDPLHGFESASHTDLDHVLTKGTDIGDDVDIAGTDVGDAVVNGLDLRIDLLHAGPHLCGLLGTPLRLQLGEDVAIVVSLLGETVSLGLQLLPSLTLLAQSSPFLALGFLLRLLRVLVVQGQSELFEAQTVVALGNAQIDHGPESLCLVAGAFQSLPGGLAVASFDGEDAVLGFGVVGPQHHLGHVGYELTAFGG